eukprot:maker-scaffold29_size597861-snap-gene-1.15 protein:Tk04644 transcript:maker-scaffold29_size597861-snap-gene-1.15-mRNA-1 annotation:"alpha-amylase 1"
MTDVARATVPEQAHGSWGCGEGHGTRTGSWILGVGHTGGSKGHDGCGESHGDGNKGHSRCGEGHGARTCAWVLGVGHGGGSKGHGGCGEGHGAQTCAWVLGVGHGGGSKGHGGCGEGHGARTSAWVLEVGHGGGSKGHDGCGEGNGARTGSWILGVGHGGGSKGHDGCGEGHGDGSKGHSRCGEGHGARTCAWVLGVGHGGGSKGHGGCGEGHGARTSAWVLEVGHRGGSKGHDGCGEGNGARTSAWVLEVGHCGGSKGHDGCGEGNGARTGSWILGVGHGGGSKGHIGCGEGHGGGSKGHSRFGEGHGARTGAWILGVGHGGGSKGHGGCGEGHGARTMWRGLTRGQGRSNLGWNRQFAPLVADLNRRMGLVKRLLHWITGSQMKSVIEGLIMSKLRYGPPIFSQIRLTDQDCQTGNMKQVQVFLNKLMRLLAHQRLIDKVPTVELSQLTGIQSANKLCATSMLQELNRAQKGNLALSEILSTSPPQHSKNLRSTQSTAIPLPTRTNSGLDLRSKVNMWNQTSLPQALICAASIPSTLAYTDLQCQGDRSVIVHLFEWTWDEIARECEEVLGPKGFCGVQVSPPHEHIPGPQWWTRYQVVSYALESRGGTRAQFESMVQRCADSGVNIMVDAILNHAVGMDQTETMGVGGSSYDGPGQNFPAVSYTPDNFNQPPCEINYGDAASVRDCYLLTLSDLDQSQDYVQEKLAGYLNDLISIGVKGFRFDASKHMWPEDLASIEGRMDDVSGGGQAFVVHEVIDQGGEPITVQEYYDVGRVTEFRYGIKVAEAIRNGAFGDLAGVYDPDQGMGDQEHALVFIDNHDNQRSAEHGGGGNTLTYKEPFNYKLGVSFMLAHDYGSKRVMSSYFFEDSDQGAPTSAPGCGEGWVCEHRWNSIGNMVEFANAVNGETVENWVGEADMVAFSRGAKGFYAMGNVSGREFATGLPDGDYCDIISECAQTITISGGMGTFALYDSEEPAVAICVGCGALFCATSIPSALAYTDTNCQGDRSVIVHLFEWTWDEIARECEEVLGPKGFCGVQVSPAHEHIEGPAWWTRYQVVSYALESRSGTRAQFESMVQRCADAGVNIIVDGILNHAVGMDQTGGMGVGGSSYDGPGQSFPAVPYTPDNFNQPPCDINYGDPNSVRDCYLLTLSDLDQSQDYVQEKLAGYLNDLIGIGVKGFRLDASKHMWPKDLAAIQGRMDDLPEGGQALVMHEVIDQGGEPITVQEYFDVGRVTEFRYGIKVAEAINNGAFENLAGVYDPGWGMCDQEHALVFIDNHDNQRGHGGGGNTLTHKDPFNYKLGVSFMLAHDYGFKRVMSSYFFDDPDQGPPTSAPGCDEGWVCEHRWKSIGNMVEFANAVNGEPLENWVGEADMVAFSRGAKGFYAMGNVGGREFVTGLPDGEYCDIISDCVQKITISGGMGTFDLYDSEEPAVAICVGCGGASVGTTSEPGDTTTAPSVDSTTVTTSEPSGECCETITLSSSGAAGIAYPELMGDYVMIDEDANGRGIYEHKTILTDAFLHYTEDPEHRWEGWQITSSVDDIYGFIANDNDGTCPKMESGWDFLENEDWHKDPMLKASCSGGSGGETTTKPSGGSTNKPPEGMARTIIFIERETFPGSDVFIVGGVSETQRPDCGVDAETSTCSIDIELNPMPKQWESYNGWMEGDTKLDWDGPQADQGLFDEYEAFGTPGAWTTDDATDDFYYELNTFGPHHWIIDLNMDCSQTEDGWFEFNTVYTIGGEEGEPAIAQEACTGDVGGTAPYPSDFHVARCGYVNVFSYGDDGCQIDDLPA